jgi:hypothetical protein
MSGALHAGLGVRVGIGIAGPAVGATSTGSDVSHGCGSPVGSIGGGAIRGSLLCA